MDFSKSKKLLTLSHTLIPGGCHTYAKGEDQYPQESPAFIARGEGCHVWDVDGNEFIEYGMGLRSVTLGHVYPVVAKAAEEQILLGNNFTRPSPIELECAAQVLSCIEGAERVKFAKDGSSITSAAVKLARAYTGRDRVGICADDPFLSYDDWFIGVSPMNAGIPKCISDLTVKFRYNDIESVKQLFDTYPDEISCIILEPARSEDPRDKFLHEIQAVCRKNGAVFILDENITGFRWHLGGGQKYYDIVPDLSCFGKAIANGFALSALAGKKELMDLGGIQHAEERVFLLSTTHGAETPALAASVATLQTYRSEQVIEHLWKQGERLATGFNKASQEYGLGEYVEAFGKPCNLVFKTWGPEKQPSQPFRTLFLQETLKRGVLMPSLVVSYSHSDEDIERTLEAVHGALGVYKKAMEDCVENYLVGPPSKVVFRKYN